MSGDRTSQFAPAPSSPPSAPPRLLDQLREAARQHGQPEPTVAIVADWCRRFILFHGKRHPQDMGSAEVGAFLDHLANHEPATVFALAEARGRWRTHGST
jgi:hypothetical protein